MRYTYKKNEKLKNKRLIDALFSEGKSISVYPLRMIYISLPEEQNKIWKVGVSVSKRSFKRAVDRNRIKRLMRECYRLNKPHFFNNISRSSAFMILYLGNETYDFDALNTKMKQLLKQFVSKN
ncbi:ribonuclease P protein component [Aegicerativicinus sediminis]|uniref:ribonuclease P protein component n=1 Tax=Aegicerativicinus sediminis TaxID=2893202 RepID=UPI001E28DE5B|nr:ribonuclease P protein component [Aegicerativicinus sediminis]